jgi:SAM-dependent methyltransferase
MNRDEIDKLYRDEYAAKYDDKYLFSEIHASDTRFEVGIIKSILENQRDRWLDVACGTGYFLAQFPGVDRAGCDISPAMLRQAREANPGVPFHEHSFLEPNQDWNGKWNLVSCMWYAYCYVERMDDVWKVFDHLAGWTAPGGTCFLPYCDLNLIFRTKFPRHELDTLDPGRVFLDGIVWSYEEHTGEYHRQLFAPHPESINRYFSRYFEEIEVVQYPPGMPEWELGRYAMVARNRTVEGSGG